MYTLILTLAALTGTGGSVSTSVEHVPGFSSQRTCLEAGNAWINNLRNMQHRVTPRAVCVKVD